MATLTCVVLVCWLCVGSSSHPQLQQHQQSFRHYTDLLIQIPKKEERDKHTQQQRVRYVL